MNYWNLTELKTQQMKTLLPNIVVKEILRLVYQVRETHSVETVRNLQLL